MRGHNVIDGDVHQAREDAHRVVQRELQIVALQNATAVFGS